MLEQLIPGIIERDTANTNSLPRRDVFDEDTDDDMPGLEESEDHDVMPELTDVMPELTDVMPELTDVMDMMDDDDRVPRDVISTLMSLIRGINYEEDMARAIAASLTMSNPSTRAARNKDDLTGTAIPDNTKLEEPCVICMDEIEKEGHKLCCGHYYHKECILQSLIKVNDLCPMCRAPIVACKE
jgi:hypothetical protein